MDSPPTLDGSAVLFGCRDGSVYALKESDGSLAWRCQVPKTQRYLLSTQSIESAWPIHGSVLVLNELVYGVAGRWSVLDGGLVLFGLKVIDGTVVHMRRMSFTGKHAARNALQPDVLISDGEGLGTAQLAVHTCPGLRHRDGPAQHDQQPGRDPGERLGPPQQLVPRGQTGEHGQEDPHLGISEVNASRPFGKLIVFNDDAAYSLQSPYTFRKLDKSPVPALAYRTETPALLQIPRPGLPHRHSSLCSGQQGVSGSQQGQGGGGAIAVSTDGHTWTQDITWQLRVPWFLPAKPSSPPAGEDRVNTIGEPETDERVVIQAAPSLTAGSWPSSTCRPNRSTTA